MNPKVFVSHASEDKERFVLDFATKLRSKGIDAWIDKWEMYPGDSLIDKIFEEGIKNAQAVIVVLSKNSVDKPWIREELNASMVKRIQGSSKLIPVVIDDCEVPECLKSTVWEKITDLKDYEVQLDRVVMSIYGQYDKPPLGDSPPYAQTIIDVLPDLTKIDTLILKISCEKAIEVGHTLINNEDIWPQLESLGISQTELFESAEVLSRRGYIREALFRINFVSAFIITLFGFDIYARAFITEYTSIFEAVVFQIVNGGERHSDSIAQRLNQPHLIVEHIFDVLENKDLVQLGKSLTSSEIVYINPELKRTLRNE
jgi:hypothetical protein